MSSEKLPSVEKFLEMEIPQKKRLLGELLDQLGRGAKIQLAQFCGVTDRAVQNWPKLGKAWVPADREPKLWEFLYSRLRSKEATEPEVVEVTDAIFLREMDEEVAAGMGRELTVHENDVRQFPASRADLRSKNYMIVRVTGDSMEPGIKRGSRLIVNLRRTDPRQLIGKVVIAWWFNNGNGKDATIKRLRDDGERWCLEPDNRQHPLRFAEKTDPYFQVAAVENQWANVD